MIERPNYQDGMDSDHWFVWSWIIVLSDLLLGLGRLVRGRLESAVPGAWSGIVLRVRVPPSRIVEDHMRWTGPSTGSGLHLTCPRAGSLQ